RKQRVDEARSLSTAPEPIAAAVAADRLAATAGVQVSLDATSWLDSTNRFGAIAGTLAATRHLDAASGIATAVEERDLFKVVSGLSRRGKFHDSPAFWCSLPDDATGRRDIDS
ncbi:MAG: hypothetical protein AAFX06_23080, partial [Planctomycetota bacterium]